mmetsp:Transcript_39214/g.83496  ORF Transcript_39214/g.83496 Transcript_39214/m.83496 type:complete len:150 (-) Transcript_39214:128-577(-)
MLMPVALALAPVGACLQWVEEAQEVEEKGRCPLCLKLSSQAMRQPQQPDHQACVLLVTPLLLHHLPLLQLWLNFCMRLEVDLSMGLLLTISSSSSSFITNSLTTIINTTTTPNSKEVAEGRVAVVASAGSNSNNNNNNTSISTSTSSTD